MVFPNICQYQQAVFLLVCGVILLKTRTKIRRSAQIKMASEQLSQLLKTSFSDKCFCPNVQLIPEHCSSHLLSPVKHREKHVPKKGVEVRGAAAEPDHHASHARLPNPSPSIQNQLIRERSVYRPPIPPYIRNQPIRG